MLKYSSGEDVQVGDVCHKVTKNTGTEYVVQDPPVTSNGMRILTRSSKTGTLYASLPSVLKLVRRPGPPAGLNAWLPKAREADAIVQEVPATPQPRCVCNSFTLTWVGHDMGCPERTVRK